MNNNVVVYMCYLWNEKWHFGVWWWPGLKTWQNFMRQILTMWLLPLPTSTNQPEHNMQWHCSVRLWPELGFVLLPFLNIQAVQMDVGAALFFLFCLHCSTTVHQALIAPSDTSQSNTDCYQEVIRLISLCDLEWARKISVIVKHTGAFYLSKNVFEDEELELIKPLPVSEFMQVFFFFFCAARVVPSG